MTQVNERELVARLQELVHKHRVCYEVWPEVQVVKGERVKVGFALELSGIHGDPAEHVSPGCQHCHRAFKDLQQIAEWIMPKQERLSYYDVPSFDNALRSTAKRMFRLEVVLCIRILHRQGFDQPVDACEETCLKEMRQGLDRLGVLEGVWRARAGEASPGRSVRRENL